MVFSKKKIFPIGKEEIFAMLASMIHPMYRVAIQAWPNQADCGVKLVKYLELYPQDTKAWITLAQSQKRPIKGEILRTRLNPGVNQSKRKISNESMIRARKVLNVGLNSVEIKDRCQLLQAWGLLEIKHGKEEYGIALLEYSVRLCKSMRDVLVWSIVRRAYQHHLRSSDGRSVLNYARHLVKSKYEQCT